MRIIVMRSWSGHSLRSIGGYWWIVREIFWKTGTSFPSRGETMLWKPSWDVQLIGYWSLRLDFFYFDQLKRLLCKSFSPAYIDHLIFGVGVGWDKIAIHIPLYVMRFCSGVVGHWICKQTCTRLKLVLLIILNSYDQRLLAANQPCWLLLPNNGSVAAFQLAVGQCKNGAKGR